MPFGPTVGAGIWAANGARTSAQQARLQLYAQTKGAEGVISAGDLRVTALNPASNGVAIAPGGYVAPGREVAAQGSYTEHMTTSDTSSLNGLFSANTTNSPRIDLICVRVEDPSISGTPWGHNPATDPLSYFRIIEDVTRHDAWRFSWAAPGQTGVALSFVEIPANVSNPQITDAMLTNVRNVINPWSESFFRSHAIVSGEQQDYLSSSTGEIFPDSLWKDQDWGQFTIPEWATRMRVRVIHSGLTGRPPGGAWGDFWVQVGPSNDDQNFTTQKVRYNTPVNDGNTRPTYAFGDDRWVPKYWRGRTTGIHPMGNNRGGPNGTALFADWNSFTSMDLEFYEVTE